MRVVNNFYECMQLFLKETNLKSHHRKANCPHSPVQVPDSDSDRGEERSECWEREEECCC
jgi:hypothetical protein